MIPEVTFHRQLSKPVKVALLGPNQFFGLLGIGIALFVPVSLGLYTPVGMAIAMAAIMGPYYVFCVYIGMKSAGWLQLKIRASVTPRHLKPSRTPPRNWLAPATSVKHPDHV